MVELLLREGLDIQPIFVWVNEKCEQIQIFHSLNLNRMLVLKKMNRAFTNISPCFKPLFINKLIDNCPFKCCCNALGFYILPHPFNSEIDDQNYLLGTYGLVCLDCLRIQPL